MENDTEDEDLAEYKAKLGAEFGTMYFHCLQHYWQTTSTWDQHETLFWNEERNDLMNESGGWLAHKIELLFREATVAGIARLLDPIESLGNKNVTLLAFPKFCEASCGGIIDEPLKTINSDFSHLKQIRNKVLSHNDYLVAVAGSPSLNWGTRLQITNLLTSIHGIFKLIHEKLLRSTLVCRPIGNNAAIAHLIMLHRGRQFRDANRQGVARGEVHFSEYYRPPNWLTLEGREESRYSKLHH